MAEYIYTSEELDSAKAFLRDRIRNEQSMSADVLRLLELYAAYILTALFGNVSDYDINLLIEDLIEQLMNDVEILAIDEHDNKDAILQYMYSERYDGTLKDRVNNRIRTFVEEVTIVYLVGNLMGESYQTMLSSIKGSLKNPWQNPILVEAREGKRRGSIAFPDDWDLEERHYGQGIPISSLTALDSMLSYAVADAWMWWGYEDALARGAKGYFVERGSSYPCDECDSHTGIFYSIGDDENRPQYHKNCCCYVIYCYTERL